jgi:hypothetical protein
MSQLGFELANISIDPPNQFVTTLNHALINIDGDFKLSIGGLADVFYCHVEKELNKKYKIELREYGI